MSHFVVLKIPLFAIFKKKIVQKCIKIEEIIVLFNNDVIKNVNKSHKDSKADKHKKIHIIPII
jgi:hypothetical protein